MKKLSLFIACAMLGAFFLVSCNNDKKNYSQRAMRQEVQEKKQAMADSVLAQIDALAEDYIQASEKGFNISEFELSDKEKQVRPDYLLDPSEVNKLVTKSQKVNALAIYMLELSVRKIYGMPLDDTKEAITKLIFDLNHPMGRNEKISEELTSEKIRSNYNACKERGELEYFWQFHNALLRETDYLLAKDPELYLSHVTDEELSAFNKQWVDFYYAINLYAKYDDDMAQVYNTFSIYNMSIEDVRSNYLNVKMAKETFKSNKFNYIEKRNALLQ